MFKKIFKSIKNAFKLIGLDFYKFSIFLKQIIPYVSDFVVLKRQRGADRSFRFARPYPVFGENTSDSGTASGPYFHQDLLVAREIYKNNPNKHVDIGSRIDGFVGHVAVFRDIEVFDIRPQENKIKNITFKQVDLASLGPELVDYCDSISSLHVIEHIGLGRYGDPLDYYGHIKALENIYKILKPGGKFYFSVPIGPQRIEFNAHRVFDIKYLLNLFNGKFLIEKFSYVDDGGNLFENANLTSCTANNCNCNYGCGIFEMIKI